MFMKRYGGLSAGELLIMLLFFALVASIPLPNRSRGGSLSKDSTLTANLSILRTSIDLYRNDHGGAYPPAHRLEEHLKLCTTPSPQCVPRARDTEAGYVLGPYLRTIPPLDLPTVAGVRGLSRIGPNPTGDVAWVYHEQTGHIRANTGDLRDPAGRFYADY